MCAHACSARSGAKQKTLCGCSRKKREERRNTRRQRERKSESRGRQERRDSKDRKINESTKSNLVFERKLYWQKKCCDAKEQEFQKEQQGLNTLRIITKRQEESVESKYRREKRQAQDDKQGSRRDGQTDTTRPIARYSHSNRGSHPFPSTAFPQSRMHLVALTSFSFLIHPDRT